MYTFKCILYALHSHSSCMLQQQRYIALYCYTFVAQLNYPAYCVAVVCCTRCYSRHYRSLAADALPLATHSTHQRHNANDKYVALMCVCVAVTVDNEIISANVTN